MRRHNFAVVLLDVMMPGMDGFETAARIRQTEGGKHTPIIFVTAYHQEGVEQTRRGYGSGAVDFLYKPIDPEVLRFKVSVFVDLHRQAELLKKASARLQTLNDVLEQKVEERTAELRASNEELREFAHLASHDLKEPLRTIALYADLTAKLHGEQLGSDGMALVQRITDGAQRMDSLLNDLLAYSLAANAGTQVGALCDSEAALIESLKMLEGAAQEKAAVITRDRLPQVAASFHELLQLFQNLIGNALKYCHANQIPHIHISARECGEEWLFSVRDNGQGIDARHHDQVFRAFRRLHGREYPGNGIGLAICKKIVERRKGRIWIESSQLGQGSTFYFTLPGLDRDSRRTRTVRDQASKKGDAVQA
jgi:two-component system, sensor histidine kinase and response regulator